MCLPEGQDFTMDQLKRNFKRLAVQLHPDKNPGVEPDEAAHTFRVLTEAYQELRAEYERWQGSRPFNELRAAAASGAVSGTASDKAQRVQRCQVQQVLLR